MDECTPPPAQLPMDLEEIRCSTAGEHHYENDLECEFEQIAREALTDVEISQIQSFDDVRHGVMLARTYALTSHNARNQKNRMFFCWRNVSNSAALLTLQRIETIRGTCAADSPLALAVWLRDSQLLLTNSQMKELTPAALHGLLKGLESSTRRCAVCDDFLYEEKLTTLSCGHTIHRNCYAILSMASSDASVSCPDCSRGEVSDNIEVLANMSSEDFVSQMNALDQTLESLTLR